jgi:hypothetical protein
MCRLFPSTLVKKANKWFNRLPPLLIHNFRQLRELFVAQFSFRIPRKRSQEDLRNIKQGINESLKDYLNRYDQESILIDNRSPEVMKNQLISRLQVSEFYRYIKHKNIIDLAHFRRKDEEWIAMEEACAVKKDDLNAAT